MVVGYLTGAAYKAISQWLNYGALLIVAAVVLTTWYTTRRRQRPTQA